LRREDHCRPGSGAQPRSLALLMATGANPPGQTRAPRRVCSRAVSQHTLSVLVENKPGVLSRVAGMFTRRGYNIDSLTVSPTERDDRSRMTITVDDSRFPVEQITKQLDKLINVIKVRDLDPDNMVARELGLFKVSTTDTARSDVLALVDIFKGEIVDVTSESLIIQATGTTAELENLEELLRNNGLVEMVRTGVVALGRGGKTT